MHLIRKSIKYSLAFLMYYTGLLFILKKILLKNRCVVFMLHRVLPFAQRKETFSDNSIIIDDTNFDNFLNFISDSFHILDKQKMLGYIKNSQPMPDNSCLLSFDDGWIDNYQYAFPLLIKHGVPALIFLPMDYVNSEQLFWQEKLGHGIRQCILKGSHECNQILIEMGLNDIRHLNDTDQRPAINRYVRSLKSLGDNDIDGIVRNIESVLGKIHYGELDRYLTTEQIREMHDQCVSFGSHACSHRLLTRMPDEQLRDELRRSKLDLESILEDDVDTIAYPNGNHNQLVCEMAAETGYRAGFTTVFGHTDSVSNPYRIKRINISDEIVTCKPVMLATILGIFH